MNPWTQLLESLHSALLDELVERAGPKEKPVLGLPSRLAEWGPPPGAGSATKLLLYKVTIDAAEGVALLALEKECGHLLKTDADGLWKAILRRAGGEFVRRGIQPRFQQPPVGIRPTSLLPKDFPVPSRVIWIPIHVGGHGCFFGIAA